MVKPERRTRVDLAVSAAILVAVVVAGFVAWNTGSASKTVSETAPAPSTAPSALVELPAALREAWTAQSDRPPLALGGSLVLSRGGEVAGHDPATGQRTWRYQRDSDVCGLTDNAGLVLAFYRDVRGCGEVMALDPGTGQRRASRTSREDHDVTLTGDGNYAVVQGPTRVDVFRSDLVRTVEYGKPDVPVNPGVQPRSGCTIGSALPAGASITILEACPTEPYPRLTVIGASPKEASEPQETSSVVSPDLGDAAPEGGDRARLITATANGAVVYVPAQDGRPARVTTVDPQGRTLRSVDVTTGPGGAPREVPVVTEAGIAAFFTGTSTVVVDAASLAAAMVIPGTLGPGAVVGGQLVVPGPTSLTAYDLNTRAMTRSTPIAKPGYTDGPVLLAEVGTTMIAQWGSTVQAYRAA
ncbi:PQQ-binding-like beta-propeller repeat protein [Tsukamurella asaccharolytica]|uniref:PQQ-binding-like beta-propeller repeat protein n=1 Tax=Tsukamurella asaccharolytica TaxID=2592067 RepID=A0A5C5R7E9_9ACTN|nr:PQQ-binding-like beta-propeller repeat protein [Tsukamurella asaccharolytica]TWS18081.1 PQQ-binding-like beta-propeller repeat protein [Tsukamurella asaccharolytica]